MTEIIKGNKVDTQPLVYFSELTPNRERECRQINFTR